MLDYARLGVLYYVIYNPEHYPRDRHDPFEVYRLEQGQYVRQSTEPFWMPEIGLGIGRVQGVLEGQAAQEWLTWFTPDGEPLPIPEEQIQQLQQQVERERQRAEQEAHKAAKLADKLRELGIDPHAL